MKRRYQQLIVWQKTMELVSEIYKVTGSFSDAEKFGLTAQMRRAAVSIPSNIAEGAGRGTDKEFIRFLQIARGSLFELETQLEIARRLQLIDETRKLNEQIHSIFAMLNNLIQNLKPEAFTAFKRQTSESLPRERSECFGYVRRQTQNYGVKS